MPKTIITFRISPFLKKKIEELSEAKNINVSKWINEAILTKIEKEAK